MKVHKRSDASFQRPRLEVNVRETGIYIDPKANCVTHA
jgi:hypothetical protein